MSCVFALTFFQAVTALPALASALVVVALWVHLLQSSACAVASPLTEPARGRLLLVPGMGWVALVLPVAAALAAHLLVPLDRFVLVARGEPASLVVSWVVSSLVAWLGCGVVAVTRVLQQAPLRLLPPPPVLLGALLPPSPPLLALPLLRGLHRAVLVDPAALFNGILDARVEQGTLWGGLLAHAVARVADKEALARHWARGVAPLPPATGLRVWFVQPVDPRVGLADLPELLLWMRVVTLLIERSLHHDRSGVFTAHRSLEVWLAALCRLYHVLQAYLGVRALPAAAHGGYLPSPEDARHLVVRQGDEWHGIFNAGRADALTVPLPRPPAARTVRDSLRDAPSALRDECRLSVYRLLTVFGAFADQFDSATLAVIESFRSGRE